MKTMRPVLCAVLALGLMLTVAAPASAGSPAGNLGGTAWTTVIPPNPEEYGGAQRVYMQIHRNGTYIMFDPPNGDYASAGLYRVTPPNQWSLTSQTSNYSDHGTYQLVGRNKLVSTDKFGTKTWRRLPAPFISQRMVDGTPIPAGVPRLLRLTVAGARKHWHRDAIATSIDVGGFERLGDVSASISLYSPSSKAEEIVTINPYWAQEQANNISNSPQEPITTKLADLPQVIATARHDGLRGKISDALLMNYSRFGSLWLIEAPKGAGYFLPTGAKLRGPNPSTEAIAQDNRQWEQTIDTLRRFIKQVTATTHKCSPAWMYAAPGAVPYAAPYPPC